MFSSAGFYFIPGALSVEEQCQWTRESLTSFPQPPNRTNHNAIYGPMCDLFIAAKERKVLIEEESLIGGLDSECNSLDKNIIVPKWKISEEPAASSGGNSCKSIPASGLLRKLRWSTLGLQFEWSKVIAISASLYSDYLSQLSYADFIVFHYVFLFVYELDICENCYMKEKNKEKK